MRSVLGLIAAAFFAYQALNFAAMGTYFTDDALTQIAGDPAAVAITSAVRTLSIGFAIISLAVMDWSWLNRAIDRATADRPPTDP